MNLQTLFERIEYTHLQGPFRQVEEITYDSRQAGENSLFVCLVGALTDGHRYARSAYENGCRAFLCQYPVELPEDAFQAVTPDSRSALAAISATFYGYPAEKLKLIGITGTKGKTTTALLVQSVLEKCGIPCGYIGSNGVIFGQETYPTSNTTPESLVLQGWFARMVEKGITHAVLEVSSQALEHNRVQGLTFDMAVFTNLSPDHIGQGEHDSFESYRAAKRRLFTDHGCKTAIFNGDDEASGFMCGDLTCRTLRYSTQDPRADFYAENMTPYREETALGVHFTCSHGGRQAEIWLRNPGSFSVYNGLAALAVCSECGADLQRAGEILKTTSVSGRFEVVEGKPGCIFIIDYAHNGLSLTSALKELRQYGPKRLICLFGSVGDRTQCRRRELAEAASRYADLCILTSDNPGFEDPGEILEEILSHFDKSIPYILQQDRARAVQLAVELAQPGDIVLFAGKGHEDYQLIGNEKMPFSERQLILDACAQQKEEKLCI